MSKVTNRNFNAGIRFRVPPELRARLARIAAKRCKLVSEVSREAVIRFVENEEAKERQEKDQAA